MNSVSLSSTEKARDAKNVSQHEQERHRAQRVRFPTRSNDEPQHESEHGAGAVGPHDGDRTSA